VNLKDRDAFLNAIHATPDDDAPRLVFTDWLEENGEVERAEFIRIQIAMKQEYENNHEATPRLEAMFQQQKSLFNLPWADTLRRCQAAAVSTYSRGFSTAPFHMSASTFADEASELSGWFGPLPRLVLSECEGQLRRVAERPELCWIHSLSLRRNWRKCDLFDSDIQALCKSRYLGSLRELGLHGTSRRSAEQDQYTLSGASCRTLARTAGLKALLQLDLTSNAIGDEGARELANAKQFGSLRVLILHDTEISASGADALARSKTFGELTDLRLTGNSIPARSRKLLSDRFGSAVSFDPTRRRR